MDSRDDFSDLKLIDQFIPLEQLEYTICPFSTIETNLDTFIETFKPVFDISDHSYTDSNESNLSTESSNQTKLNKYPEPYAIMIVKAILSRKDNVMQLKDIYNYFITNYESFAMEADATKWKNSIRHNLSRHKYFIKTSEKNAQGHFWSIDEDYLKYFKQGIYDCKTLVKQAKLKRKANGEVSVKKVRRSRKSQKENLAQEQSSLNSFNNDSAYLSTSDITDNSFTNYISNSICFI